MWRELETKSKKVALSWSDFLIIHDYNHPYQLSLLLIIIKNHATYAKTVFMVDFYLKIYFGIIDSLLI